MVVNESAENPTPRGVCEFIVGTPPGAGSLLQGGGGSSQVFGFDRVP